MDTDLTGPGRTRPDQTVGGLVGDLRGPNGLCRRSKSPTKCGRARLVEFERCVLRLCIE